MKTRRVVSLCLGLLLAVTIIWGARPAQAHLDNAPFTKINGHFTTENPLSHFGTFTPPDLAPASYVLNTKLTGSIDTSVYASTSQGTFQWQWDNQGKDYSEGVYVSHSYNSVGTHLVTISYKPTSTGKFGVIDQIEVPVIPSSGYQMPKIRIESSSTPGHVHLKAQVTTDKSASTSSYSWLFGASGSAKGQQADFNYKSAVASNDSLGGITVIDSNHLRGYAVFKFSNDGGLLRAADTDESPGVVIKTPEKGVVYLILGAVVILVAGACLSWWFWRRTEQPKK